MQLRVDLVRTAIRRFLAGSALVDDYARCTPNAANPVAGDEFCNDVVQVNTGDGSLPAYSRT
jgi:hypothetical protein